MESGPSRTCKALVCKCPVHSSPHHSIPVHVSGPLDQQSSRTRRTKSIRVQSTTKMTETWDDYTSDHQAVRRPAHGLDSQAPHRQKHCGRISARPDILRPARTSPAPTPGQRRPTLTSQGAAVLNPRRLPATLHTPRSELAKPCRKLLLPARRPGPPSVQDTCCLSSPRWLRQEKKKT